MSSAIVLWIRTGRSPIVARAASTTPATSGRNANGAASTRRRPDSIFDRSRMLLITVSSRRPLDRTVCASSCCCASSRVATSSSARPITPLMGVRISWLMLARNSLLARVARSARAVASASAAVRSRTRASRLASVSPSAACAASRSATACRRWLSRSRRRATIASRSRCSSCTSIGALASTGRGAASRPRELISRVSSTSCSIGQVTRRAARRANGTAMIRLHSTHAAVTA